MAASPTALSPGQILEAGVQMTLAPGMSDDGKLGDNIRTFGEDRIRASGSLPRPGRVSERRAENTHTLANIDLISASRIRKVSLKEPTHHSISGRGTTSSSIISTSLHLMADHHT